MTGLITLHNCSKKSYYRNINSLAIQLFKLWRNRKNKFKFNELDFRISTIEIEKAIRKLARGKAGGINDISNVMLKCSGSSILLALSKLFNLIYNSGVYPDIWRSNILVPVHKKGDVCDPANYRGIALSSC